MLTLYTQATGNGRKASIMLEEVGLRYRAVKVDLRGEENRLPSFMTVNPIGKIPAVVEEMPGGASRRLFGSGAILLSFAERTGRLLPADGVKREEALSWFMAGISDLSPASGAFFWLTQGAPEDAPKAIERAKSVLDRCFTAAEVRLGGVEYLAEEYSIADIAWYPFVAGAGDRLEAMPNLRRWRDAVGERPAVKRGMAVPE